MLFQVKDKQLKNKINKYDKNNKVVFASQAAINMCWARMICKYILDQGFVPVNYFTAFGHFVHELADQQKMIDSINSLIVRCDELWVFGDISEGMWHEVKMCKELGIPIHYYCIKELPGDINEISENDVRYHYKFLSKIKKKNKYKRINKL